MSTSIKVLKKFMNRKKTNNDRTKTPLSRGRRAGGEGEKGKGLPNIPLHAGAEPYLFKHARELRREMTDAEKVLWNHLRARRFLNLKFRRQHPILEFIADFYCHELRLVIEADGGYHEEPHTKYYDNERSKELKQYGITVVRFSNEEILEDLNGVLAKLKERVVELKSALPRPLSSKERGFEGTEKGEYKPNPNRPKTTPTPSPRGEGRGEVNKGGGNR